MKRPFVVKGKGFTSELIDNVY